jgi:predicted Rossmann fold flavoprotein
MAFKTESITHSTLQPSSFVEEGTVLDGVPLYDVVIIGGGASGVFCGIRLLETNPSLKVLILEASQHPLQKVRVSGGGRCNVTHDCFEVETLALNYPRGGKTLKNLLRQFNPQDMVRWLAHQGVSLHTEADGRMFPMTNSSETIIDCFLKRYHLLGGHLWTGCRVTTVTPALAAMPHEIHYQHQTHTHPCHARHVVFATGSNPRVYALLTQLGVTLVPPVPSLFTFGIPDKSLHTFSGVSFQKTKVKLTVAGYKKPFEYEGPVLITHWGLSGPAVLKASAFAARALAETHYQASCALDFTPSLSFEAAQEAWQAWSQTLSPKTHLKNALPPYLSCTLSHRFWEGYVLPTCQVSASTPLCELKKEQRNTLIRWLKGDLPWRVTSKGVFKEEFVTAGGVALKDVDFGRMALKKHPRIHVIGELLDIDGITGGFNFQNAWSTANAVKLLDA